MNKLITTLIFVFLFLTAFGTISHSQDQGLIERNCITVEHAQQLAKDSGAFYVGQLVEDEFFYKAVEETMTADFFKEIYPTHHFVIVAPEFKYILISFGTKTHACYILQFSGPNAMDQIRALIERAIELRNQK